MGTPQTRWREMHQSGRVAIMLEMRSSPQAGIPLHLLDLVQRALPQGAAVALGASMEMNHCSVARKMTGLWQRQQCGYECSILLSAISAPRALQQLDDRLIGLKDCLAFVLGQTVAADRPAASTLHVLDRARTSRRCRSRPRRARAPCGPRRCPGRW